MYLDSDTLVENHQICNQRTTKNKILIRTIFYLKICIKSVFKILIKRNWITQAIKTRLASFTDFNLLDILHLFTKQYRIQRRYYLILTL